MNLDSIKKFAPIIQALDTRLLESIEHKAALQRVFLLKDEPKYQICYTPFEYVNPKAKLIIVGITPGYTQFANAITAAKHSLSANSDDLMRVLMHAKKAGAFSGELRKGLVRLMNHMDFQSWLGVDDCYSLFKENNHLIQTTSVLRNAVFLTNAKNYNGTPKALKNAPLRSQILDHFVPELNSLPQAMILPLGAMPNDTCIQLANEGLIDAKRLLPGIPHPSGANNERIDFFLGKKHIDALSAQTNGSAMLVQQKALTTKLQELKNS